MINEASIIINQMQMKKNFEFASINLTKKSNEKTLYCETMFENFQQLKKTSEKKMSKLMTKQFEKKINLVTIDFRDIKEISLERCKNTIKHAKNIPNVKKSSNNEKISSF